MKTVVESKSTKQVKTKVIEETKEDAKVTVAHILKYQTPKSSKKIGKHNTDLNKSTKKSYIMNSKKPDKITINLPVAKVDTSVVKDSEMEVVDQIASKDTKSAKKADSSKGLIKKPIPKTAKSKKDNKGGQKSTHKSNKKDVVKTPVDKGIGIVVVTDVEMVPETSNEEVKVNISNKLRSKSHISRDRPSKPDIAANKSKGKKKDKTRVAVP